MKSLEELKKIKEQAKRNVEMRTNEEGGFRVAVGMGTCGIATGAKLVLNKFVEEIAKQELDNVSVTQVGCMGTCTKEPMVEVRDSDGRVVLYGYIDEEKVLEIIESHLKNNEPVEKYKISNLD